MADKKDLAMLRSKYYAYRKKMMSNPDTAPKVVSFKTWLKQRGDGE